jgi:hypothetical protein
VLTRRLISGLVVGPALVKGVTCQHLAFRSPGVNWEIWIESGKRALPRRQPLQCGTAQNQPVRIVRYSALVPLSGVDRGRFTSTRPTSRESLRGRRIRAVDILINHL